jgi:hypothetical protein
VTAQRRPAASIRRPLRRCERVFIDAIDTHLAAPMTKGCRSVSRRELLGIGVGRLSNWVRLSISATWPLAAHSECGAWVREILK